MARPDLPLSAELQQYVDGRVAAEGFRDQAAYLQDLIARDHEDHRADVARVQALIDEGIASGIVDREPEDVLDDIIADILGSDG